MYAEEGSYRESITESALLSVLAENESVDSAKAMLFVLRRLLEAFCLLDIAELGVGKWSFVSYPAYLFGRSFCETLFMPGQQLFDTNYWQQGDHRPAEIEAEQRRLIVAFEFARKKYAPSQVVVPIRRVYVAWGIVRLGGKYLMHRDKKAKEKHYGFPGGRLNLFDIGSSMDPISALGRLSRGDDSLAAQLIEATLRRELKEELPLLEPEHYDFVRRQVLDPYCSLGKNQPAYTEYHISMYDIRLTSEGEARLVDCIDATDEEGLAWFSVDDLLAPEGRIDGKTVFIDVLRAQQGKNLRRFLDSIPDSSGTIYRLMKESDAVDIPNRIDQPFGVGPNRHVKNKRPGLDENELALLNSLVANARELPVRLSPKHLKSLGGGWVKYVSDEAMTVGKSLARKLDSVNLPLIANIPGNYVRLAIKPDLTYFSNESFTYSVRNPQLRIVLALDLRPWSRLDPSEINISLDSTMVLVVKSIQEQGYLDANKDPLLIPIGDFQKKLRDDIDGHAKCIGLRKLIRLADGAYSIAVPREIQQ